MDKRIGYVKFNKTGSDADQPCACAYDNGDPCHWTGPNCKRIAFIDPSALAALETQLAEANAGCGLKDGALKQAKGALLEYHQFGHPHVPEFVGDGCFKAVNEIEAALSLTPEAVKEEAGYARAGKAALIALAKEEAGIKGEHGEWARGFRSALQNMRGAIEGADYVIAQAREGEKRG